MKKLTSLIKDIVAEASKKPEYTVKFGDGKANLPKPDPDKHDSTYHQEEPAQVNKPPKAHEDDTTLPTAEKDQKDVLDRMEKQSKIAVGECEEELTEAQKIRKMQEGLFASVNEEFDEEEEVIDNKGVE